MNKNKLISKSGLFSYALSIIYLILIWFSEGKYDNFINYAFIGLHVSIILLGILIFLGIYFAISTAFMNRKMKESDKNNVRLMLKTFPHRMTLGIIYWITPIGMYLYSIFPSSYLYIFKWFPLFYPVIYYFGERYIKNKETEIGSPIIDKF